MAHSHCQTTSGHNLLHAQHNTPRHAGAIHHFGKNLQNGINQIFDQFADALAKRAQRRALMRLSESELSDIGLSRSDAEAEYRKSFPL